MPSDQVDIDDVRQSYPQLIHMLALMCRPLLTLPLAEMAAVNEEFQTIAPIVEPTAYMRQGAENLHDQRKVIDGALALRRIMESIK
jgi:hypothetical protein